MNDPSTDSSHRVFPLAASAAGTTDDLIVFFCGFEFDPRRGELKNAAGQPVGIRPKAEVLLREFLTHPGKLLSKDELILKLWPTTVVTDDSLVQCIVELRATLKDTEQRLIKTVSRRGYRFDADVHSRVEPACDLIPVGSVGRVYEFASALDVASTAARPRERPRTGLAATLPPLVGRDHPFVAEVDVDRWDVAGAISASSSAPDAPALPDEDTKAKSARSNLPSSLTALVGRKGELAALAELVERNTLVSTVGAPGVGKTLLAQHLLKNGKARYRQGVCWIEFDGVSDPQQIVPTMITALGIDASDTDQLRGLCAAMAHMELLIGLDNVEHLAAEIAAIAKSVMAAAPRVRLLVTSQVPLRVVGEHVYRVEPLSVPVDGRSAALSLEFGAVELFVRHARSADPHFALTDGNAPAVVELCQKVDGLPLAIELVAARAPVLGLGYLLHSVENRLKLLAIGANRYAPPRHRTLRAALEWGHGLLEEQERILFRRLAIFAGSASLESVTRTIALSVDDFDESLMIDSLLELANRSFLILLPSSDTYGVRYRLANAARALGMEHLAESGEMSLLRRSHAMAMGELAETAYAERYAGKCLVEKFQSAIELDLDNLREAQVWARSAGIAELELRLIVGLLLALPKSLFAQRSFLADRGQGLICEDGVSADLACRAWIAISRVCFGRDSNRSHEASRQAVLAARGCTHLEGYTFLLYNSLCSLVRSPRRYTEDDGREAALAEARAIEVAAWPPHRTVMRALAEAFMASARIDAPTSDALNVRVVSLYLSSGADPSLPLGDLTDVQLAIGNPKAAAKTGWRLVESLRSTRNALAQAYAHLNLTAALLAMDDLHSAKQIALEGWSLSLQFDLQPYWADYLTLMCALEGRMRAAALLGGFADSRYALSGNDRSRNESTAIARARSMIARAMTDAQIGELRLRGSGLHDSEIARIAFAIDDDDAAYIRLFEGR